MFDHIFDNAEYQYRIGGLTTCGFALEKHSDTSKSYLIHEECDTIEYKRKSCVRPVLTLNGLLCSTENSNRGFLI